MQRQPAATFKAGVPLHESLEKDAAAFTVPKQSFRRVSASFWRELHNPIILMSKPSWKNPTCEKGRRKMFPELQRSLHHVAHRPQRAKVIYHYEAGTNNELKQISVMEKGRGRFLSSGYLMMISMKKSWWPSKILDVLFKL